MLIQCGLQMIAWKKVPCSVSDCCHRDALDQAFHRPIKLCRDRNIMILKTRAATILPHVLLSVSKVYFILALKPIDCRRKRNMNVAGFAERL